MNSARLMNGVLSARRAALQYVRGSAEVIFTPGQMVFLNLRAGGIGKI